MSPLTSLRTDPEDTPSAPVLSDHTILTDGYHIQFPLSASEFWVLKTPQDRFSFHIYSFAIPFLPFFFFTNDHGCCDVLSDLLDAYTLFSPLLSQSIFTTSEILSSNFGFYVFG
jgi:hypothetical protein